MEQTFHQNRARSKILATSGIRSTSAPEAYSTSAMSSKEKSDNYSSLIEASAFTTSRARTEYQNCVRPIFGTQLARVGRRVSVELAVRRNSHYRPPISNSMLYGVPE